MAQRTESRRAAPSPLRAFSLAIGFACAIAASVMIFVTENAEYLRIGIVVALWGFVFAALAAGRRQVEQVVAVNDEAELRRGYELELEREVNARREYELRLETQLRREVQDAFASQVGGLHEELVLLRQELSDQWDSELRVERMVMRTQSVRVAADQREALEPAPAGPASIESELLDQLAEGPPAGDGAEDPAVADAAPSVPTAPVPPLATASSTEPARDDGTSSDVLTRVLAEANASALPRRRRHRYSDEEEDAVSAWS